MIDTGEAEARKSVVLSEKDSKKVFENHRTRMLELKKELDKNSKLLKG